MMEFFDETEFLGNERFTAVVSNPPYQISTIKDKTSEHSSVTNIFQYFQQVSDIVSEFSCMIYPGERWMSLSGRGMRDFGMEQLNSTSLQKVVFFQNASQAFGGGVKFSGGVSVVVKNRLNPNNGKWLLVSYDKDSITDTMVKFPGRNSVSSHPQINDLLSKVRQGFHNSKNLKQMVVAREVFSIDRANKQDIKSMVRCNSDFTNKPKGDFVKALLNDSDGTKGRGVWLWMPRENVPRGQWLIPRWKVIISAMDTTGLGGTSPKAEICEPGAVIGSSRLIIGNFETGPEAKNFLKFLETDIVRTLIVSNGGLIAVWGENVPDLQDYTDNSVVVDFTERSQSLNDQLCVMWGLDKFDEAYVAHFSKRLARFQKRKSDING